MNSDIPALIVEGFSEIDTDSIDSVTTRETNFTVMYAGALNVGYGVELLLDAFRIWDCPTARLWLFGKGNLVPFIKERIATDSRIVYHGFVSGETLDVFMQRATLLVMPRPSTDTTAPYIFPSKLLEYMASGTPVASTPLPGIPREYSKYIYVIEDETITGLARLLTYLFDLPRTILERRGVESRSFVRSTKNYVAQGMRIAEFLNLCESKSSPHAAL
jgi:glycosyltransferase involved in cell wall biosynthesis